MKLKIMTLLFVLTNTIFVSCEYLDYNTKLFKITKCSSQYYNLGTISVDKSKILTIKIESKSSFENCLELKLEYEPYSYIVKREFCVPGKIVIRDWYYTSCKIQYKLKCDIDPNIEIEFKIG